MASAATSGDQDNAHDSPDSVTIHVLTKLDACTATAVSNLREGGEDSVEGHLHMMQQKAFQAYFPRAFLQFVRQV